MKNLGLTQRELQKIEQVKRGCPTPYKLFWSTETEARKYLSAQLAHMATSYDNIPVRVYPCKCSKFHTTSQEKKKQQ